MFNTLLITDDSLRRDWINGLVSESRELVLRQVQNRMSGPAELIPLINRTSADIVFLDIAILNAWNLSLDSVFAEYPKLVVLMFGEGLRTVNSAPIAGIAGSIPLWTGFDEFSRIVGEAIGRITREVRPNLFTFLPAKAGSGSTTIVLQLAFALARSRARVLVIEADLRSGAMALFLNRKPATSVQQALSGAFQRVPSALDDAKISLAGVDFLLSNNSLEEVPPDWAHYYRLIEQTTGKYDYVLVDLPELVNPATADVVRRSAMVLTVSTTEVAPLKLAEQRRRELEKWGLPRERMAVILNRWQKSEVGQRDVENLLAMPVYAVVPNAYHELRTAVIEGRAVAVESAIGKAMHQIALRMLGQPPDEPKAKGLFGLFRS